MTRIKTAEKKPCLDVVECSLFDICFSFDVGVFAYLDVRCSMLDVHLLNNLALMTSQFTVQRLDFNYDFP